MLRSFSDQWNYLVDQIKAQAETLGVPAERIEAGKTGKQVGQRPYVRVFLAPAGAAARTGRGRGNLRKAEIAILCAAEAKGSVPEAVQAAMDMAEEVCRIAIQVEGVETDDDNITIIDGDGNGARVLLELNTLYEWAS